MKNIPGNPTNGPAAVAAPAFPAFPAPAPPAAANPPMSLTDLFMMSIMSQPGSSFAGLLPQLALPQLAPGLAGTIPAALAIAQPRTAPPSPAKRHSVTVEQFCDFYDIDEVDCTRLKDVGFRPGDPTDAQLDEELRKAGFAHFSWKRIHSANMRFRADVAAGQFDS